MRIASVAAVIFLFITTNTPAYAGDIYLLCATISTGDHGDWKDCKRDCDSYLIIDKEWEVSDSVYRRKIPDSVKGYDYIDRFTGKRTARASFEVGGGYQVNQECRASSEDEYRAYLRKRKL